MIEALETLKAIPHWVCYKNESKAKGEKPTKMPKSPFSGQNASSTNQGTWGAFLEAVRAKKRFSFDGLGWVFTEESGIVGIDLDDCINDEGQVAAWARNIIEDINSYTEISPSGRGVHIFVYGKIPRALGPTPGSQIEMYAKARYFTVTGQMFPGSFEKIAHRQGALDSLWETENEYRRQKNRPKPQHIPNVSPPLKAEKLKAYTEKSYLEEMAILSMATRGNRNDTLNRRAFNLGQFIEAGLLNQSEVEITLFNLATQLGLGEREALGTIQSGLRAGLANPRSNWPADDDESTSGGTGSSGGGQAQLPRNDLIYHEAIKPHLDFILNRWGLSAATVEMFRVGYCEKCPTSLYSPSFTIPYYEKAGDLLDIRHQLLSPNGQGNYRPEIENYPPHLFNAQSAKEDWAILVNREFNTMLLWGEYDIPVIGLPSTFKREWLHSLENLKKIYIALDPAQEQAARSIGRLLAQKDIDVRICSLPFSPRDMLVKYGCSLGDFIKFIEQGWGVSI